MCPLLGCLYQSQPIRVCLPAMTLITALTSKIQLDKTFLNSLQRFEYLLFRYLLYCVKRFVHQIILRLVLVIASGIVGAYASEPLTTSHYVDNKNGTITDMKSNLMWKQCVEGLSGPFCSVGRVQKMTWIKANEAVKKVSFAGYQDWRLPTIQELRGLFDRDRFDPSINTTFFPNTPSTWILSDSPAFENRPFVWAANFYFGFISSANRQNIYVVRLVRQNR